MIAVVFESWPKPGRGQDYINFDVRLSHLLEGLEGFISVERFQSVSEPGKFVALSFWQDDAAIDKFRNIRHHRDIQAKSRAEIFDDYRLRVATVLRDYRKHERALAPADSLGSAEASRPFAVGPKASPRRQ